ncbi:MAG TPA: PAS domain S-box protein, partial [Anaerolineae bacterium]|nr:PAS domain S-box protein [Anaerolineae bacterium]
MRIQWTIRRRLLSLVISVALPLVIMILLNGTAETLDARQRSQSQLLQLARAIARQLDLLIEDERLPVDTAALDTAHLQEKARIDFLPPQYVLTIIDPQGGVVFRSADSDRWIGQDVDDSALVRQAAQAPEGVAEMADLDGVPRLHGYATTSTAGWRVLVSAPPAVAYAQVWNVIGRNILLSVAVVIVALLMARLIMRRINPPLQALIAGARAVSAGDDDVQVEPAPDRDLADLATAFNQMVARRREATTQLEQAAARYRELFENSRDALFVIDLDGRTIDANAAATRLTGYRLDELRDNRVLDLMPLDAKERSEARAARYRQAQGMRELILVTRDGRQVPVEVAVTPIAYEGRTALLGAARDISERRESEERLVRLSQRILTLNEAGLRMQETFDPEAILQIVGEELGRQRFSCLLAFLSDDQQSAQVRYVSEPDWLSLFRETTGLELIGFTFPLTGAAAQRLIREQHTFMEENVRPLLEAGLPPDARPAARDMFIRLRLTRVIVAPLVVDRRVTALLIVARHDLQEVDTPAIAAFASQAAVTLENARLYAEATQKTEEVAALNEIAAIVSRSLDLPAVLDAVLTQLGRVVEYDSASVFLDNGRSLAVVAARGYPRLEDAPSSPIPRGDNLYQRLLSIR